MPLKFEPTRFNNGLQYHVFIQQMKSKVDNSLQNEIPLIEEDELNLLKLNLQRSIKIDKQYQINEELKSLILSIKQTQKWLVITVDLITRLKNDAKTKDELMNKLHLWYAQNKGRVLEEEFISMFELNGYYCQFFAINTLLLISYYIHLNFFHKLNELIPLLFLPDASILLHHYKVLSVY